MKIKDVIRGVEEKDLSGYSEGHGRGSESHIVEIGYNSLASTEVVVDIPEIANIIHKGIYDKDIDEEHPVRNLHIYAIAKTITTAIESGSIISLKKEEKDEPKFNDFKAFGKGEKDNSITGLK